MKTVLRLLLIAVVLILLLGAGAWWYLFGPNTVLAAELVPADSIAFLTIPNAAKLVTGYETSDLKKLVDSPDAKPLIDAVIDWIGHKNADLILAFLPNLSGQSFIAITHFDPNKPEQVGLIAGMKPKFGSGNFDAFIEKLKATYPDTLKQGTTGAGQVAGVDYQWIQGPGAPHKICVAKLNGWIVTAWGEASLQDWIERLQKKSSTPNLIQSPDYQKSLERVGKDPMAFVYLNAHALAPVVQNILEQTSHQSNTNNYLEKKLDVMGGVAVGSSFEKGEIADHFSLLVPSPSPSTADAVMASPCSFDTLKFTGPDTRLYWAFNIDWPKAWKSWQDQQEATPQLKAMIDSLTTWAQGENIDIQHNILDALGPEVSLQLEWSDDTTYPEAGFFAKVNKPDDFKPTINAIIDTVRKVYGTVGVINEISTDDHHYATFQFVQSNPITPTITEDGDYFGVFLSQNQAVRSFKRDTSIGLLRNPNFVRQTGDKRNGASQILFIDSPQLLDRGYRTAMPYLSLASMFNKNLAAALKDRQMPSNLAWLAPIGTWSFVTTTDNSGKTGHSISGIGNQGIFFAAGLGTGAVMLQTLIPGFHPNSAPPPPAPAPPSPQTNQTSPPTASDTTTNAPPDATPTPPPSAPSGVPDAATNSTPSSTAPEPTPAAPAPAATSNSDASPPIPDQSPKTQ